MLTSFSAAVSLRTGWVYYSRLHLLKIFRLLYYTQGNYASYIITETRRLAENSPMLKSAFNTAYWASQASSTIYFYGSTKRRMAPSMVNTLQWMIAEPLVQLHSNGHIWNMREEMSNEVSQVTQVIMAEHWQHNRYNSVTTSCQWGPLVHSTHAFARTALLLPPWLPVLIASISHRALQFPRNTSVNIAVRLLRSSSEAGQRGTYW